MGVYSGGRVCAEVLLLVPTGEAPGLEQCQRVVVSAGISSRIAGIGDIVVDNIGGRSKSGGAAGEGPLVGERECRCVGGGVAYVAEHIESG